MNVGDSRAADKASINIYTYFELEFQCRVNARVSIFFFFNADFEFEVKNLCFPTHLRKNQKFVCALNLH